MDNHLGPHGAFPPPLRRDPWLEWFGQVALIGLNSQVFGTGLPEEDEQWCWLEGVGPALENRDLLLFQHKSFWTAFSGSSGRQGGIYPADRERVLEILHPARLLGVANGDLHRYRKVWIGDYLELWGPSTATLVHREESQHLPAGLEQLGVVLLQFPGGQVKATFQTTPGLEEVETGGHEESRSSGRRLPRPPGATSPAQRGPERKSVVHGTDASVSAVHHPAAMGDHISGLERCFLGHLVEAQSRRESVVPPSAWPRSS